jgi:hypothetical protein
MSSFRTVSLFRLLLLAEVVLLLMFSLNTMSYIISIKRFIWKDLILPSLQCLGVYLFTRHGLGIIRGLPLPRGICGLVARIVTGFTAGYLQNGKPILEAKEPIR